MASESKIDENLYSRQLGVFGHETMGKLIKMDVLIVGMKGVGVETAKNLILAGPRSVAVYDPEVVSIHDLQSNYYLNESHVGTTSRADASLPSLQVLNEYVRASVLPEATLTTDVLSRFHVVVFTGGYYVPTPTLVAFNDFCRAQSPPIGFINAAVRGVAGFAFVDFGASHRMHDKDGEPLRSAVVANIVQDEGSEGKDPSTTIVTHDGKRHGFSDGDHVVFREIVGAAALNDGVPRRISNCTPFSFQVENARSADPYISGGVVEQVKVPTSMSQKSLAECLTSPVGNEEGMMITPDLGKFGRPEQLHIAFQGLEAFLAESKGTFPAIRSASDAASCVAHAKAFAASNSESLGVTEVDEKVVETFAQLAATELPALTTFFGGVVAQEVVKFTGKFTPLNQYLYLDAFEVIPSGDSITPDEFVPAGAGAGGATKYDHLTAIIGKTLMARMANHKVFLVGAGALGCEFLKNFASMGLCVGDEGMCVVTDMDRIEKSNLNRQFLFRSENVGQPKSSTAAAAAVAMNPDLKVRATEIPVGHDTEETFDDDFWTGLDLVVNALDNLKARLYVDGRCVFYRKPLMESGTLGTKANTQVIMPFKTESYGDSVDPPEESIPMCTLRNFPHQIEHCIEWARDVFEGSYATAVQDANLFARNPTSWLAEAATESNASNRRSQLQGVHDAVSAATDRTFEMCVRKARFAFNEHFNLLIRQLLHNFPVDYVDSKGVKFWSGPKRPPTALDFNPDDKEHMNFICAAAHLYASNFGVPLPPDSTSPEVLKPILASIEPSVPPFVPKTVRIKTGDEDTTKEGAEDDDVVADGLASKLQTIASEGSLDGLEFQAAEFEKDDDTNFHIDFITATANLRARNYKISEASHHKVKMIAGKIIPAIATTTCMITGLVCLEIYKVLQDCPVEAARNSFVNLAVNVYSMSEPGPPKKNESKDYDPTSCGPVRAMPEGFSSWDRVEIREGDLTCGQLVEYMKTKYNLDTQMVSAGPMMLFAPMMYASHRRDRTDKPLRQVYEEVTKTPLPPKRKYIVLDMTVEDDESDVLIPQVQFFFA